MDKLLRLVNLLKVTEPMSGLGGQAQSGRTQNPASPTTSVAALSPALPLILPFFACFLKHQQGTKPFACLFPLNRVTLSKLPGLS